MGASIHVPGRVQREMDEFQQFGQLGPAPEGLVLGFITKLQLGENLEVRDMRAESPPAAHAIRSQNSGQQRQLVGSTQIY
jgi:hypothetical protein